MTVRECTGATGVLRFALMAAVTSGWAVCGSAQAKKTFRDARYGVLVEYPAGWRVDAAAGFAPAPVILGALRAGEQPLLRVGFGPGDRAFAPYRGSTLEGAEFIALVVEGGSAKTCRERLDISGYKSGSENENGVWYGWTLRTEESAGRTTTQKVYASFRQRRCYLYEEDLHEALVAVDEKGHTLTPAERAAVRHDLEAVMGSVLYVGGLAR